MKQEDGGGYTAEVLMHINDDAFSLRFDPEHVAAAEAAEAAGAKSDAQLKSMVAGGRRPMRPTAPPTIRDRRRGELTCSSTASSACCRSWSC